MTLYVLLWVLSLGNLVCIVAHLSLNSAPFKSLVAHVASGHHTGPHSCVLDCLSRCLLCYILVHRKNPINVRHRYDYFYHWLLLVVVQGEAGLRPQALGISTDVSVLNLSPPSQQPDVSQAKPSSVHPWPLGWEEPA